MWVSGGPGAIDPRYAGDDDVCERLGEAERKRELALAELVLPEMLASCMVNDYRPPLPIAALSAKAGTARAAESWRPAGGSMTGASGPSEAPDGVQGAPSGDPSVVGKLITHIEAGDLGKISLVVERTIDGLRVLLAIDDPATLASAEAQRGALEQSLRASGLGVVKLAILRSSRVGTELAHQSPVRSARSRRRLNLTG